MPLRLLPRPTFSACMPEPFADNAASCRVLEKAGFRLEGVMRHSAVKNGVVRDMRLYSLLREDLECIGS